MLSLFLLVKFLLLQARGIGSGAFPLYIGNQSSADLYSPPEKLRHLIGHSTASAADKLVGECALKPNLGERRGNVVPRQESVTGNIV